MTKRLVFDVESIGIHGEGWAVGYVLMDGAEELSSAWAYCYPWLARGTRDGRDWVRGNCGWAWGGAAGSADALCEAHQIPLGELLESPLHVRAWFWDRWLHAKLMGCELWADVPWPVEARFLIEAVEDFRPSLQSRSPSGRSGGPLAGHKNLEPSRRENDGPYRLLDVESYVEATKGGPPPEQDPSIHHPLLDARRSADRLLWAEGKYR